MWRGPPLSDLADQPFAAVEARRLEEMRLAAVEDAVERDLQAGRHADVARELEALTLEEPLRERLQALRMVALYRSGRQADALAVYRRTRSALVDEIGAEPGPELQLLHKSILRQEPALDLPINEPVDLPPELQARTPMAGREADLDWLRERWRSARGGLGRLVRITGPGGIGKTRLAAELASEVHRDGATVLFVSGAGAPDIAFTVLAAARAARHPALLVLDDADRLPEDAKIAVAKLSNDLAVLPVLILATAEESGGDNVETLPLAPLGADGVRALARLYGDDIPADALVTVSEGIPRQVHRAAAEWAGTEAARRLGDAASRAARERARLRADGLEPSHSPQQLERQILRHDEGLAARVPTEAGHPVERASAAWYRRAVVLAGMLAMVAAGSVALLLARDPGDGAVAAGSGAGVYDPKTGELLRSVPLGTAPSTVAVGERGVWVLDADDKTVSRIDPSEHTLLRTFSTASTPTDLAVGAGAIWVGNGFRKAGLNGTFLPESVSRIDPESNEVVATIPLHRPRTGPYVQGDAIVQQHIAVSNDAVWAINPDLTVSRIDPRMNRVVARVTNVKALAIAAGDGRVWMVDDGASVAEIDTTTNRVVRRIEVPTDSLTALAVGAGAVWVANPLGGSVWRIDFEPDPRLHEIPLALGVGSVAFGAQSVWATNEIAGEVYRIDPRTNRARVVSRTVAPHGVAFGAGAVWVTAGGPPSPDKGLPASACGRIYPGGARRSQLLLVSNLPLRGAWRDATVPMVEAIRFVLERRGFKAGRFPVGIPVLRRVDGPGAWVRVLQVLLQRQGLRTQAERDRRNRRAQLLLLEVSDPDRKPGPRRPACDDQPQQHVDRAHTPLPGMRRGELEARYPSRARNYVRIAAADHLQAAADAELARQLGSKRLFVLSYGDDPYLAGFAEDVSRAAQQLGLEIAGARAWNPEARDFSRLARQIGRARADAVFIGGHLAPNGGELVRDLRAQLGHEVHLIATDYFWTIPDLTAAAGSAAEGTYVSVFGLPNSELPPNGKQFLTDFKATRGGDPGPSFAAAYAAQATEIMLDAIARSDGSRASVTRELQRTTIDHGILGTIRFDENGDLLEGPFTILRVTDGPSRNALILPQFDGAVVDRVITARPLR